MSIATKYLTGDATYWPPSTPNGYGGKSYGTAVVIKARWVDEPRLISDNQGQQIQSQANVVVPEALLPVVGGMVAQGVHGGVSNPASVAAWEIKAVKKTPDLRNTKALVRVFL